MNVWDLLDLVGDLLFLACALGFVTFVALYGLRSHWRATAAGRVTFAFMAVVASIMASAILFGLWDGHEHERLVVRVVLFAALLGGIVHYHVILLRAQRAERRERAGRHRSGDG